MHTQTRRAAALGVVSAAALAVALLTPVSAFADAPVALSGTLTDAGAPVSNADVYVYKYDATQAQWDQTDYAGSTAADGTWSDTPTLADGSYGFWFGNLSNSTAPYSLDQGVGGTVDDQTLTAQFTVTGGVASATNFPLSLVRNAGKVVVTQHDADTNAVITTAPYGSVSLGYGFGADGGLLTHGQSYDSESPLDGVLEIAGVEPGTYYEGQANNDDYYTSYFTSPITVTAGATTSIDVSMLNDSTHDSTYALFTGNQPRVKISGEPKVGTLLTASITNLPAGVTARYQWYDISVPILGANSATFSPTTGQLGHQLYVYAYLNAPGHGTVTIGSTYLTAVTKIGDPNAATVGISGSAILGKTIKATVSGATLSPAVYAYQWYRNGAPLAGQDGSSYTITKKDLGKSIRVGVTSVVQGHLDAIIPSAEVIAKDKTALTASVSAKSISTKTKLTVRVSAVKGDSKLKPSGKYRVYYTATKYKTVKVKGTKTATVTLPKLSKGKHTIKVVLDSNKYSAKNKTFTVKVHK